MNPLVFVTLDTLIKTNKSPNALKSTWTFNNTILELVRQYKIDGYRLIVLGNRFSVGDGLVKAVDVEAQLEAIQQVIDKPFVTAKDKVLRTRMIYCASRDTYEALPNPGMIYRIAVQYEGDLSRSILIGSSIFDLEAQRVSGIVKYIDTNTIVES